MSLLTYQKELWHVAHSFVNCHNMINVQRRQGTVRFKSKAGGEQTREALLETKTHRRVNRRQVRV